MIDCRRMQSTKKDGENRHEVKELQSFQKPCGTVFYIHDEE